MGSTGNDEESLVEDSGMLRTVVLDIPGESTHRIYVDLEGLIQTMEEMSFMTVTDLIAEGGDEEAIEMYKAVLYPYIIGFGAVYNTVAEQSEIPTMDIERLYEELESDV